MRLSIPTIVVNVAEVDWNRRASDRVELTSMDCLGLACRTGAPRDPKSRWVAMNAIGEIESLSHVFSAREKDHA